MNTEQLLNRLQQTYSTCMNYSDEGRSETTDFTGTKLVKFKTFYHRPNCFIFEWTKDDDTSMIWSDGLGVYEQQHAGARGKKQLVSPLQAIAGATGVSDSTAWNILSMIFNLRGRTLLDIVPIGVCLNGSNYTLNGSLNTPNDTTLTVSCDDFVLRQIVESRNMSPADFEHVYNVVLQSELDDIARGKKDSAGLESFRAWKTEMEANMPNSDFLWSQKVYYDKVDLVAALPPLIFKDPAFTLT